MRVADDYAYASDHARNELDAIACGDEARVPPAPPKAEY